MRMSDNNIRDGDGSVMQQYQQAYKQENLFILECQKTKQKKSETI